MGQKPGVIVTTEPEGTLTPGRGDCRSTLGTQSDRAEKLVRSPPSRSRS